MKYREYQDNELISYIAEGNEDANEILFQKYEPFIQKNARNMLRYSKNLGLELNDLIQEGMLGLHIAIQNYSEHRDTSFYTFAKTCIERKMISLVIGSNRLKHKILNDSLSLEYTNEEGDIVDLENLLQDSRFNPELQLDDFEHELELTMHIKESLTDFEEQVFELKIAGFDYHEIADVLDKDTKSVDNALQRIRNKIKKVVAHKID